MERTLPLTTRRRLHVQGFTDADEAALAAAAPWHRLAFGLCALLTGAGTALASPPILWTLALIAAVAAFSRTHPFDLLYNHGIRYLRGTGPLPKRHAQSRFACGLGAVGLAATALAFGHALWSLGYLLGATLTLVAGLVSTTDICIPSMVYNLLFHGSWRGERPAKG